MIVLDTTVLVYAKGAEHPLRDPCRDLIEEIANGSLEATTSVEAIQEFAHIRARRRTREDAADLARAYVELLSPLLEIDGATLRDGLALFERTAAVGAFDAVLAAGAIAAGAEALVSADRGFAGIAGIRHVIPDADGIAALAATIDQE